MELTLKNIGIIKDSTIKLDGLTVITGPISQIGREFIFAK